MKYLTLSKVVQFPGFDEPFNFAAYLDQFVWTLPAWRTEANYKLAFEIRRKFHQEDGKVLATGAVVALRDNEYELLLRYAPLEGNLMAHLVLQIWELLTDLYTASSDRPKGMPDPEAAPEPVA